MNSFSPNWNLISNPKVIFEGMRKADKTRKKPSKKHHYLPRYYLQGFTDGEGNFFVYDKQADKILPKTNPGASFFENNLNTVTLPSGNSSDFLEKIYRKIENDSWNSLDSIRNSTFKTPIKLLDKMNLFLFLLFLHWRLPSNIEFAERLSEKFFQHDNEVDYFRLMHKTGKKAPQELIERIKGSPAFKKVAKTIVAFAPFFKDRDWGVKLENWRFIYSGDEKSCYIVGDNPIVTKGGCDHDPINCLKEFIFPVSGKILLVNVNKLIGKELPPEFIIQYNVAIIERAQRFVAHHNKDFLEAMITDYKLHVRFGRTDNIIMELFRMLEGTGGSVLDI